MTGKSEEHRRFDAAMDKLLKADPKVIKEKMEADKQELATIESMDSGAVYTLALKTHVGMSIDVWRYFAGWCENGSFK